MCDGIHNDIDYKEDKETILAAYSISPEGYRLTFWNLNKLHYQTYSEFVVENLEISRRWLKSANVDTFDQLVNLMVFEEFKRKVLYSTMVHITEKKETDLIKASKMVDVFSLIHRPQKGENLKHY